MGEIEEKKPQAQTFSPVSLKENGILNFWRKNKIFEKSLKREAPNGLFTFYDGPPFATGLPHYGHILASILKDVIPRYQTMLGKKVRRRWGWDCHGLPIENLIETELGLKTKKEIEAFGVGNFNKAAGTRVTSYVNDWKKIIPRIGRWADMENDYKTMDWTYSESVWWVFKTLFDKGLVYENYKSMHLCPRCETTLSNFEVNQGYKDITDISVTAEFEIKNKPGTYLLAWTTTPWTLPGNVTLAVNPKVEYVLIEKYDEGREGTVRFILAKDCLGKVFKGSEYKIIETFKGSKLIGEAYKPLFDYYSSDQSLKHRENGWKIYGADFVTTDDGTGIVHIAPAFGEEDMELGKKENLPFIQHVGTDGTFKPEVKDFAGLPVKPKNNHQSGDVAIIKYLAAKNSLFAKEKIIHSYPHCWRCDTPLLNYASNSWFVKVTAIKDALVKANNEIHWTPEHIKIGRFGKWLEGARDWAVSRSRYWGAPIPVWRCEECKKNFVAGSVAEIKEKSVSSGNHYFVMRHGQAENNVLNVLSSNPKHKHKLTDKGKRQVVDALDELKKKKLDYIFSSDLERAKETVEIIREGIGLAKNKITFDERLREVNFGKMDGAPVSEYSMYFSSIEEKFSKNPPDGENLENIKKRMMAVLLELEKKYANKNILIITHSSPAWVLFAGASGMDTKEAANFGSPHADFIKNAEIKSLPFKPYPYNENYEMDLHRPYIDAVILRCECGGEMRRLPEVFDCWFESGSMPYGQAHYPFENKEIFDPEKNIGFPADFIAEGLDQTRGWFYTLLVLSVGLFSKASYKNVIVNGLVLAEDGQKMSKRLKNYPDPMYMVENYGADALRYYLLSSPVVQSENLNFSEKGVAEVYRKVIVRLDNVINFYSQNVEGSVWNVAGDKPDPELHTTYYTPHSNNVLDIWITACLIELNEIVTDGLNGYELDKAVKAIGNFVDDLSTWYIRRSRNRMRFGDLNSLHTTHHILHSLSIIIAPFMPFVAEDVYRRINGERESVHLENWLIPSTAEGVDESDILDQMKEIRRIASLGLEIRDKAGIKVRQPLATLKIKTQKVKDERNEQLTDLIKDEVNVKEVIFIDDTENEVELDTNITEELKKEGILRDLVRAVQDLRKKAGLKARESATLNISTGKDGEALVKSFESELKSATSMSEIIFGDFDAGEKIDLDGVLFNIKITP